MATRVNPPKVGKPLPLSAAEYFAGRLSREEMAERVSRDCRGTGQALVGSLLMGLIDRDTPIYFETRALSLKRESSRIVGVVAEQADATIRVSARKGVIIATGGFEWNEQFVKSFLRGPDDRPGERG